MTKIICPKCGSIRIVEAPIGGMRICLACESFFDTVDGKSKHTVFDRITSSPEVLAPKLVYRSFIRRKELRGNGLFLEWKPIKIKCYKSKVIPGVYYKNSTEAIAATVAKLKEVANAEN